MWPLIHVRAGAVQSTILASLAVVVLGSCSFAPSPPIKENAAEVRHARLRMIAHLPMGRARAVALDGDRAFVARNFEGMTVVEVADPSQPKVLGHLSAAVCRPLDVAVAAPGLVAVADRFRGLLLMDVTNLDRPTTVAELLLPGIATAVDVFRRAANSYVAVAAGGGGVHLVDITNVRSPRVVTSHTLGTDYATQVRIAGSFAYLANNDDGGFEVFHLDERTRLHPLYRIHLPGYAVGVDVRPPLVAVALRTGGFALFRELPTEASRTATTPTLQLLAFVSHYPDYCQRLAFVDPHELLVANNESGVQLYDLASPEAPVLEDSCEVPGEAVSLAIRGPYIYVCAWDGGFVVLHRDEVPADIAQVGTMTSP